MPNNMSYTIESNFEITPSDVESSNKISSPPNLNVSDTDGLMLYSQYHANEIEQNKKIYDVARRVVWAGFGVMLLGIVLSFFSLVTPAIITTAAGIITEVISGVIFAFLLQSNKNKMDFYKQLAFDEECKRYIRVVQSLNDEQQKELLSKLIDNYCKRRK